jgi:hypothetical protein
MGVIGSQLVHRVDQLFGKEELTNVLNSGIGIASVITGHIGLHSHMNVGSSAIVVAGEDSEELSNSGLVGFGDSSQECFVISGSILPGTPSIKNRHGIRVDSGISRVSTSGIASLEIISRKY